MSNKVAFVFQSVGKFGLALFAGRFAQAAAFFVMAHTLASADMAVVAVLTLIFSGLFQLTNLGFERYVVYVSDRDQDSLESSIDAVWTMQLFRAGFVAFLALMISIILLSSEKYSVSSSHLFFISVAAIFVSLVNPGLAAFERSGNFAYSARIRAFAGMGSAIVSVFIVIIWETPWAYVVGQVLNALAVVTLSFYYVQRWPRVRISLGIFKKVFGYSKHILVISIVSFVSLQAQNFYIAVFSTPAVLAMYFTWHRFVSLPGELITQFSSSLLFAKASDENRRGKSLAGTHLKGFIFVAVCTLPFHVLVWFHGDEVLGLVAGQNWTSYWSNGRLMVAANVSLLFASTIGPFMLVHLPHVSSALRSFEALSVILMIAYFGAKFSDFGVLLAVLIVGVVSLIIRIFVLYRYLIERDRWAHASVAITTVGLVLLPFLGYEVITHSFSGSSISLTTTLFVYAIFSITLFWRFFRKYDLLSNG